MAALFNILEKFMHNSQVISHVLKTYWSYNNLAPEKAQMMKILPSA